MYDVAKAVAKLKGSNPPLYIWSWGPGPLDPACINRNRPDTTQGCKPMVALTAHIHPDEWDEL